MKNNNVIIFDTTLRDGEQSPGATMTKQQKILIAEGLDDMKVDIIEAGFAAASTGDFECIKEISKNVKNSTVCSLARAINSDLEYAAESIKKAQNGRIHTFIATSPLHMKYKLNKTPQQILEIIEKSVSYARKLAPEVEFSAEDASRSDIDFLTKCVETAIKFGATTINIPDTVGYAIPDEYHNFIKKIIENTPNSDKAIFSVHCHNDLGLATANTLSGIHAGARQAEVAINGLGERAGNAALEEVVMALKTRENNFQLTTNIKTENIIHMSKLVSASSGFSIQRNKAIVGANAFLHESGIHQDGILKNKETYEIMKPETIGINKKSTIVLGKHSGRSAFKEKLENLNIKISNSELQDAFKKFKMVADNKKYIQDEDIFAILGEGKNNDNKAIKLVSFNVTGVSEEEKYAYVTLLINEKEYTCRSKAKGTLGSLFTGINKLCKQNVALLQYEAHALTDGIDSLADVTVMLEHKGKLISGSSKDQDTITSSINAYINAINKIIEQQNNIGETNNV